MPRIERPIADLSQLPPIDPLAYEEAKRCPKCQHPGIITNKHNARGARGQKAVVETFKCVNELCGWYGTGWAVQINPDGSIPVRDNSQPKQFTGLSDQTATMAQRYIDNVLAEEAQEAKKRDG